MDIYATKTASACDLGSQISPKSDALIDTIGRVVSRAESLRNTVDRITGRLLVNNNMTESANAGPTDAPPYGNAQVDAERADRVLSNLESALSYLESRLG